MATPTTPMQIKGLLGKSIREAVFSNDKLKEFMHNEGYIIQRRRDLPLLIRNRPIEKVEYESVGDSITDKKQQRETRMDDTDTPGTASKTIPKAIPAYSSVSKRQLAGDIVHW